MSANNWISQEHYPPIQARLSTSALIPFGQPDDDGDYQLSEGENNQYN